MDNLNSVQFRKKSTLIKKAVSSTDINVGNPNTTLREAKSFTGNTDDLKISLLKEFNHDQSMNNGRESRGTQIDEQGFKTREVISNQVFLVKDEMLTYRGKRYTVKDIATEWKKDCRMWLWKSNKNKRKSMLDLRSKLHVLKLC